MSFLDNLKALFGGSTPAQPEQTPEEVPAVDDSVETETEMPQEEVAPVEEEATEEPITTE